MGLKSIATDLLQEPLLLALMLLCLILGILSVVFYFRCLRPRWGTTEWMKRVDRPKFSALKLKHLHWHDCAWLLLSAVFSVLLRSVYLFFWLRLDERPNVFEVLVSAGSFILLRLGLAAGLAMGLYLLLRCMFGKPLPAVCLATLSGLLINEYSDTILLLVYSLLFLYLWMCVEDTKPLLPGAFLLLVSGLLYAWALLSCWQAAWLAPFYLASYVTKQILRLSRGDPAHRSRKLVLSLFLTLVCLLFGSFFLYIIYILLSGRIEGNLAQNLRSLDFYKNFLPILREKLGELFVGERAFRPGIWARDVFLFTVGMLGLIPLCHGVLRKKDSRCMWLFCLLPMFILQWLFCGSYLLNLPLLLLLGYVWSVWCQRNRSGLTLLYTGVLAASYIATFI